MAYGPDTAKLLSRISAIDDGILGVSWLNITSLPELPETLTELYCENTQISVLPKLPDTLTHLWCWNTQLSVLPKLPETLIMLDCSKTPLKLLRSDDESIADYSKRWDDWRAEQAFIKRCKEKCRAIKDELADVPDY